MKKISIIFELLLLYIFGNFLFNIIFSITEVIIANVLSLHISLIDIFIRNIIYNFTLYTILYVFILISYHYITLLLVKKLNGKLERRKKNEE